MAALALRLLLLLGVQAFQLQGRESDFDCRNLQKPLRLVQRLDDSRFNSSSHYSQFNASQAKISNDGTDNQNDQAWCPNLPLRQNTLSEWILVTFPGLKIINNLLTAPRQHKTADTGEHSKQLFIQYKRTESEEFRNYSMLSFIHGQLRSQSIIKGNSDVKDKKNYVTLKPPLVAKQVKIFPLNPDEKDTNVCLKFELFGCPDYQGLVAYSAPQGHSVAGGRADFADHYYDGRVVRGQLTGGLGQLSDYTSSSVSPSTDPNDEGLAGLPYVGWDKRQLSSERVELLFEFDAVRRFRTLTIDVNNDFARWDARLFSRAAVSASVGGVHFTGDGAAQTVPQDDNNQFTRPVRLELRGLVGRFVRLELHFHPSSNWLLLSEVFFESDVIPNPPPTEAPPQPPPPPPPSPVDPSTGNPNPLQPPVQPPQPPSAGRGSSSHNERIEHGGGTGGSGTARESETTTYVAIIVSILLGAVLLMLAIAFLCLRRRLLRKKQRGDGGHSIHQQAKNTESIHLDFSSGRPAMVVNGKPANGSIYTSLPNSEDEEDQRTDLNAVDCYTYAPASFAPFAPAISGAGREYASATLYGPQQPQPQPPPPPSQATSFGISGGVLTGGGGGLYATGLGTYARPRLIMPGTGQLQPQQPLRHHGASATVDPSAGVGGHHHFGRQSRPALPGLPRTASTAAAAQAAAPFASSSPPPVPRFPSDLSIQGCSGNTVYACPDTDLASAIDCGAMDEFGGPDSSDVAVTAESLAVLEVAPGSVTLKERLGGGQFGEVRLAELAAAGGRLLVAAKTLRPGAGPQARRDFRREMRLLARLKDPNIVRVLGVVTREGAQQCILVEYMQHGDLHQFLRSRAAAASATAPSEPPLSYGCLIYLAAQIASGMKYLEAFQLVHRDLACRNCLLGAGYQVKICDFGMSQPLYSADYCRVDGGRGASLPIRWMAWEAVLHGRFSCRSDVWSFAVTLWEMLTFCREQPFARLSDQQVVANCQHILLCSGAAQALPCPPLCPRELYDLLCECWQRDEACRPRFREIHLFLQRHNVGFSPRDGSLLQLPLNS